MALNRATFFFKDSRGNGWSETLHTSKADLQATLTAAVAMLPFRVALLGNNTRCLFIRVSDDSVKRDSRIFPVPLDDQVNSSARSSESDYANTCLVIRLESTELVRRSYELRGIKDSIVKQAGIYTPDSTFNFNINQWFEQLRTNGWAIKHKNPAIIPFQVTQLTQAFPSGNVTLIFGAPHGLAVNDPFVLRSVRGCSVINGTYRVFDVPDANSVIIKCHIILPTWQGGGKLYVQNPILSGIERGYVLRVGARKTGRPFDTQRGRRLAVKLT